MKNNQPIHLESIEINGFKSCINTKLKPNSDLSALIGINGAGKTNILQGIRLLAIDSTRRRRLVDDLLQSPETSIIAWFSDENNKKIGLKIQYNVYIDQKRESEELSISELWNLHDFNKINEWVELPPPEFLDQKDAYDYVLRSSIRGVERTSIKLKADKLSFIVSKIKEIQENKPLINVLLLIKNFRSSISYYSASQFTDPTKCPSSFEVDEDRRLFDQYSYKSVGTHINFLHSLYKLKRDNHELYSSYCEFISRQQLGLVSRITWKEIELSSNTAQILSDGEVKKIKKTKTLVIPKVQIGNTFITFNQLSEGTFKTLALIFYIFTDSSSFLMVEEPEVCVHHGLLKKVIATIKSHSAIKQTIISTHSDLLLDELKPSQVFVVEINNAGTQVKNLDDWLDRGGKDALHEYLSESGTLGEYWRSGGLS